MRRLRIGTDRIGAVAMAIALLVSVWQAAGGRISVSYFGDFGVAGSPIEGDAISDLTSATEFPDNPASESGGETQLPFLTEGLQWAVDSDFGENYGTRARGYIHVPETGEWKFYVASDDASQLFLNPNGPAPEVDTPIAEEPDCCSAFVDDGVRSSEPIPLEAGQAYYFEVLHKQGTGDDFWQVGWTGPGVEEPAVIGSRYLQEFVSGADVLEIVEGPEDTTVPEHSSRARFSVTVRATQPAQYQWFRNGESIDGATQPFLDFDATAGNAGDTFSVEVTNGDGSSMMSETATLTVERDTEPPKVTEVSPRGDPNGIHIFFSEPVSEDTALNAANYSVNGGSTPIESIEFFAGDPTRVRLNTGGPGFEVDTTHTVEISDVEDRADQPNLLVPDPTTKEFTFGRKAPDYAWLFDGDSRNAAEPYQGDVTGSLDNGATFSGDSPFPESSGSVTFDGDDDEVNFGDLTFNGATEFTMSMWIKAAATGMDAGFVEFVDNDQQDEWGLGYDSTGAGGDGSNVIKVGITTTESPGTNESADQQESMEDVQTTEWQHIAWTWEDGEGFTLYINGQEDQPTSDMERTTGALAMMDYFRLGDGRKAHWEGQIGETAIWTDTALTASQIETLSNQSVTGGGEAWPLREVGPVEITEQPQDITVAENETGSLDVGTGGAEPFFFQWMRDTGDDAQPIEGATERELTIGPVAPGDSGTLYSVQVSNEFSQVTSEQAELTVEPDTTAPRIVGIRSTHDLSRVDITFSEPVTQTSAENTENYSITDDQGNSLDVVGASRMSDQTEVSLETADQTVGTQYAVSVGAVEDVAGNSVNEEAVFFGLGGLAQSEDGAIIFEAEHFDEEIGDFWQRDTERGNPSGGASMVVSNGTDASESEAQLLYDIDFSQTGEHIVWYRAGADNSEDDSGWLHIDGERPPSREEGNLASMSGFSGESDFVWNSAPQEGDGPMTFSIDSAGEHTFGLALRENGAFFDKFLITTDSEFTPEGLAPRETREGMPPLPGGEIVSPAPSSQHAPGNVEIEVSTSAEEVGIYKVSFFVDGEMVGEATGAPYTATWNATRGVHEISAEIVDMARQSVTTDSIEVAVGELTPQVVSAGAFPGESKAGILFDREVTEESATTPANYQISDNTVTGASIDPSGTAVTLTTEQAIESEFTVTVSGVEDRFGNAVSGEVTGELSGLSHQAVGTDIGMEGGDPLVPGDATFFGDGDYDIVAGGTDIWDGGDAMHFVYEEIAGDFDKRVRAQELTMAGSPWAKAGLMARVDTSATSRHVMNVITPTGGENIYVGQERIPTEDGVDSQRWNGASDNGSPGVPLPNAWIRLQREGDTFLAYRSEDGQSWTQTDQVERSDLPDTLLVGMPVTSHDNSEEGTVLAQFRSYSNVGPVEPPAALSISFADGTVSVTWDGPGTLETAESVAGPWNEAEDQDGEATFPVQDHDRLFIRLVPNIQQ